MTLGQPDLGEQALSKVAEIGISSQLDEVEEINVDIRTNPLKLMQGELDSVSIEGKGLVMQEDLRAEELKMNIDSISINPLSAAFGKIELNHPTQAETYVVLTEEDIDCAFNSAFLGDKLQNLQVHINGQPMTIDTKKVEFRLPGDGKFAIKADSFIQETGETKQVAFTAVPRMREGGNRLSLEDVQHAEGEEISPELTNALLEKSSELLDLRNFELEGMSLRLKHLDVQPGKLTLQAEAYVEQFPSS
jgi:LmeA-like phospholipid-binding